MQCADEATGEDRRSPGVAKLWSPITVEWNWRARASSNCNCLRTGRDVVQRIENGQLELERIRWRLGAFLLALSLLTTVTWQALNTFLEVTVADGFYTTPQGYVISAFSAVLFHARVVLMCLAPCAYDKSMVRLSLLFDSLLLPLSDTMCWRECQALPAIFFIPDAVFIIGAAVISISRDGVWMQRSMWRLMALWLMLSMSLYVFRAVATSVKPGHFVQLWVWSGVQSVYLLCVCSPRAQERMRSAVNLRLEARSSQSAAAGVAGLVGNCRPKEVLEQARRRFRSVLLSSLSFAELADNTPDPDLFRKSAVTKLGTCDAFISHSWHDDPGAKWAALQHWRESFVKEENREPRVWIDKCCINQRNVDADLRCLPVFVSGCERMVVLCGPTYLTRLWCIVELFTFVHTGGKLEDIVFVPVYRPGCEEHDVSAMAGTFREFNAEDCTCFVPEDKEKMLEVIRRAFVAIERFNLAMRDIFAVSCWHLTQDGAGDGRPLTRRPSVADSTNSTPPLSLPCEPDCQTPTQSLPQTPNLPWVASLLPTWPTSVTHPASRFGRRRAASTSAVQTDRSESTNGDGDGGASGEDVGDGDADIV